MSSTPRFGHDVLETPQLMDLSVTSEALRNSLAGMIFHRLFCETSERDRSDQ